MAAAEVNDSSAPMKEENEPIEVAAEGEHTENYQTLMDAGLRQNVAESLDNIFSTGGSSVIQWLSLIYFLKIHDVARGSMKGQFVIVVICLVPTGLLAYADLEEGVIDALRAFNEEGALSVLSQFKESDLSHVQVSYRGS